MPTPTPDRPEPSEDGPSPLARRVAERAYRRGLIPVVYSEKLQYLIDATAEELAADEALGAGREE